MVFSYIKGWIVTTEIFSNSSNNENLKISILIAVRNEAENINDCLKSILSQNYSKGYFEVILIDDFSDDNTMNIVSEFQEVKTIQLKDILDSSFINKPNKKEAITAGIKEAKYDIIITVDGDCVYQKNWLKSKAQFYMKTQAKMITSPVLFFSKKSIFSKFLELDLTALMGITAADIKNNLPSMVNGANLLFEKKVFYEVGGYDGNMNITSGDDVFLMQKIYKKFPKGIKFLKNKEAVAYTNSPKNFNEFVQQRIRWTSKSKSYADKKVRNKLVLNVLFYLCLFLGLFIFPFINLSFLKISLALFLLKMLIDFVLFKNLTHFFKNQKLLKSFLIIELLHVPYVSFLGLLSLMAKYSWKGRDGIK